MESLIPHLGWLEHPTGDEVTRFLAEGWFEYREQAFWWMYLRPGDAVIDVGAHFGLYAALAGRLTGETGRILAVEANASISPFLERNLARYAGERGELIPAALSSCAGEIDFFPCAGVRAAYSGTVAECPGATASRVRALTMDELCRERAITHVALVKVDVEGGEIEVLRGAREAIAQGVAPLWMIEFVEANMRQRGLTTHSLFEELRSFGYTVCVFDEARCRLEPVEWKEPVWWENYFATNTLDEVNRRLAECSEERARPALDILRRGAASAALRDAAGATARSLEAAEKRAAESDERALGASRQAADAAQRLEAERGATTQRLEEARHAAEAAGRRAEEASGHLEESWRRIGEANWRADQAVDRAETAGRHLEESWRRIGEANWRADQAVNRAETAAGRAEAAYRRLEVADRRAANARYEADLVKTRLREVLLDPTAKPEWARSFLASTECLTPPSPAASDASDPMQSALYHLAGKGFCPRAILDVGAGKGYWSLNAHIFFPDAEYYMVDPLDENEEALRRICENDARFHFVKAAAGDAEGAVEIYVTPDPFSSHCLYHPEADPATRRPVQQRTLDSLAAEGCIAAPSLVKIDVQGYELKVLTGAERLLETAEVLIVEVNLFRFMPECPLAHEVIDRLAGRGFVLFDLAGSLRRPFEDDLAQLDLVFVSSRSTLIANSRWK